MKKFFDGRLDIIAAGPGQRKTTYIQEKYVTPYTVVLDMQPDTPKGKQYREFELLHRFERDVEGFLDFIANDKSHHFVAIGEESVLYYKGREQDSRIRKACIDREHRHFTLVLVYHNIAMIPNEVMDYLPDTFTIGTTSDRQKPMWDKWQYTTVYDAWEKYQKMYNKPEEQIKTPNGLVKPLFTFNPNKPL